MRYRFQTIWHYGICFFDSEEAMMVATSQCEDVIFYGMILELDYKTASRVAQLHRNTLNYYELAMMPLFEGKGRLSSGTEDPVMAIASYRMKHQQGYNFILIWKIM